MIDEKSHDAYNRRGFFSLPLFCNIKLLFVYAHDIKCNVGNII